MLNRATLLGFLGKDAEIRTTQSGDEVATLSLATSESWTDKGTGEVREKTEWHRVVIWGGGKFMDMIRDRALKGATVYVEGRITTRKWVDNNKVERYATEIVVSGLGTMVRFLDKGTASRNGNDHRDDRRDQGRPAGRQRQEEAQREDPKRGYDASVLDDDDIPF